MLKVRCGPRNHATKRAAIAAAVEGLGDRAANLEKWAVWAEDLPRALAWATAIPDSLYAE